MLLTEALNRVAHLQWQCLTNLSQIQTTPNSPESSMSFSEIKVVERVQQRRNQSEQNLGRTRPTERSPLVQHPQKHHSNVEYNHRGYPDTVVRVK